MLRNDELCAGKCFCIDNMGKLWIYDSGSKITHRFTYGKLFTNADVEEEIPAVINLQSYWSDCLFLDEHMYLWEYRGDYSPIKSENTIGTPVKYDNLPPVKNFSLTFGGFVTVSMDNTICISTNERDPIKILPSDVEILTAHAHNGKIFAIDNQRNLLCFFSEECYVIDRDVRLMTSLDGICYVKGNGDVFKVNLSTRPNIFYESSYQNYNRKTIDESAINEILMEKYKIPDLPPIVNMKSTDDIFLLVDENSTVWTVIDQPKERRESYKDWFERTQIPRTVNLPKNIIDICTHMEEDYFTYFIMTEDGQVKYNISKPNVWDETIYGEATDVAFQGINVVTISYVQYDKRFSNTKRAQQ